MELRHSMMGSLRDVGRLKPYLLQSNLCCNQICLNFLHSQVVEGANSIAFAPVAQDPPCKTFTTFNFHVDSCVELNTWMAGEERCKKIHISVADEPEECLTFTRLQVRFVFLSVIHQFTHPAAEETCSALHTLQEEPSLLTDWSVNSFIMVVYEKVLTCTRFHYPSHANLCCVSPFCKTLAQWVALLPPRKRSCGKVVFLHLPVSHSWIHWGMECVFQHAMG